MSSLLDFRGCFCWDEFEGSSDAQGGSLEKSLYRKSGLIITLPCLMLQLVLLKGTQFLTVVSRSECKFARIPSYNYLVRKVVQHTASKDSLYDMPAWAHSCSHEPSIDDLMIPAFFAIPPHTQRWWFSSGVILCFPRTALDGSRTKFLLRSTALPHDWMQAYCQRCRHSLFGDFF